jgi:RNA polymerase sporulation-specific sigma factor
MNNICDKELNDIILENKNLIYDLANKYNRKNISNIKDDLFQVGALGMIDAYKHYDPSKNTKFTTFAYLYVNGEIKKFIREDRMIKVSRDIIYLCSQIEHAKQLLTQKLKREATISELSSFLEISEEKIISALEYNNSIQSIDEPINDEGKELTIQDVVYERENYDKLDLIWLRDELSRLSPVEKEIINMRYFEGMTQSETATILGLSQVNVSRTESRLLLSLRNKASK